MRKLLALAVLALLPAVASAQVTLGLRVGYAPAMGDEQEGLALKDSVESQIPVQLDVLYALTQDVAAGAYLSYGFGQVGAEDSDACARAGSDCSASSLRVGAQVAYAFREVSPRYAPWIGAGLGLEWLWKETSSGGASVTLEKLGFEFLNLQGGADYKVNERFAVGPYVQVSIGQYQTFEGDGIPSKGIHEWLNFGVRGQLDL